MAEADETQTSEQDLSEGKLEDQEQMEYLDTPPSRSVGNNQPQDEGHGGESGGDNQNAAE